jgi:hypothetical protein
MVENGVWPNRAIAAALWLGRAIACRASAFHPKSAGLARAIATLRQSHGMKKPC